MINRLMRAVLGLLLLGGMAFQAHGAVAGAGSGVWAELALAGLAKRGGGVLVNSPGTATGREWLDAEEQFLRETNEILAARGYGFVLYVNVHNLPPDASHIDVHVDFPTMWFPDGTRLSEFTRREPLTTNSRTAEYRFGYFFDEPYEMNPGNWHIVLSFEGKQIFKHTFEVYEDEPEP